MAKDELADALDEREPDEVDGDLVDGDEGDDKDDEPGEYTPPTKEEWEATQGKLKRARRQAQRLREASAGKGQGSGTPDPEKAAETSAEVERWQTRAIRGDAKAALLTAGADPDLVDLALGKLKAAEVDYDDNDEPILDDWVEEMAERYPRLFEARTAAPATRKRTAPDVDQGKGTRGTPVKTRRFGDELIAAASVGRRRR